MKLSLIVAASRNAVIGCNNQLPWHLPEDLQRFKSITMGKPLVMGRKTFDSIGRPLPGRTNIVVTRDTSWNKYGVDVANNLDAALAMGARACRSKGLNETMVIGGEQIYRLTLPIADRIYLTRVDAHVEGDAFFPDINTNLWSKVDEQVGKHIDMYPYRFLVFERV